METLNKHSDGHKAGFCWREPADIFPESTVDFCQETSLHGVKYVCQPKRHLLERIFWLVTLATGGVIAGLLISDLWQEYLNKPIIIVSPVETTIGQVPFPTITVSNSNRIRRSGLARLANMTEQYLNSDDEREMIRLEDPITDLFLALYVCNQQETFGQTVNFTYARDKRNLQELLDQFEELAHQLYDKNPNITDKIWTHFLVPMLHTCENMIKECRFNGRIVSCSNYFGSEGRSREGCCTFNQVDPVYNRLNKTFWQKSFEEYTQNQTIFENVPDQGKVNLYWYNHLTTKDALLLQLPSSLEDVDVFSSLGVVGNVSNKDKWYAPKRQQNAGKSEGLSILLNPELEEYTCGFTDGDGLLLQVHPLADSSNMRELGMIIKPNSEVFIEVTPLVTIANENLKKIPIYKRHCYFQDEKHLSTSWFYTLNICIDECIHNLTKKYCNCHFAREYYAQDQCKLKDYDCAQNYIKNTTRNEYAKKCNCLPLCTTVEYSTHVTSTEIDNGLHNQCFSTDNNSTLAKNQLSIVHIYFVKEFVYALERKKLYGWVDLIANAGGVLGLCRMTNRLPALNSNLLKYD